MGVQDVFGEAKFVRQFGKTQTLSKRKTPSDHQFFQRCSTTLPFPHMPQSPDPLKILKDTIRGKKSYFTVMITGKFMSRYKIVREFWNMQHIFQFKKWLQLNIARTLNASK